MSPSLSFFVFLLPFLATPAHAQVTVRDAMGISAFIQAPRATLHDSRHWLAVIGDSGATGAASSLQLEARPFNLWGWFRTGAQNPRGVFVPVTDSPPPTRVVYSQTEWQQAVREHQQVELNGAARGSLLLDTPEQSFGYLTGRKWGIHPEDLIFVAQDGTRVETLPRQFERIFEIESATLPPIVLISFNANDVCDEEVFNESVDTRLQRFRQRLQKALAESQRFLIPHPRGSRVVVLAPLDVLQALRSPELLAQKIPFGNRGPISCGDLRSEKIENSAVDAFLQKSLNNMCPAILRTHPGDQARLGHLDAVLAGFRQIWAEEVAHQDQLAKGRGLEWIYLPEVANIQFERGDLARDCFHPGLGAHRKISDILQKKISFP